MSYTGPNPKFKSVTFRPQSADPLNPTEGMTQYADGTVRPEGVWVYKDGSWQKVGSAGVLNFDDFGDADSASTSNFSTGNNAVFDDGGALAGNFALSTTTADLINGTKVFKYTQAAGSLNDYINRATVAVPQGYRGRMLTVKLQYKYNGASADLRFVAKDQTNNSIITSVAVAQAAAAGNVAQELTVSFLVPTTCAILGYGFQVATLNSGKVLIWDDAIVAPTDFLSLNTQVQQGYQLQQDSASMTTNSSQLRFNLSTATIANSGDSIIGVTDNAAGTRFTASTAALVSLTFSADVPVTNSLQILRNGTVINTVESNSAGNIEVNCDVQLQPGDYLSLQTVTGAISGTAYVLMGASALSTSVLTPAQEVSYDKLLLTFKSTAIALTDPVGTFNTYTYASGGNVATISASAPTQTVSDMQQNGLLLYARAYNATSTTTQPARFDIKIGPALKNVKVASSDVSFDLRQLLANGTVLAGIDQAYNPTTGILTLTAGVDVSTLSTTRYVGVNTNTAAIPASAYFTFVASQKPELIGITGDRAFWAQQVLTPPNFVTLMTNGAWTPLPFNTFKGDLSFCSLSGTEITLPAGRYTVAGFSSVSNQVQSFQLKLQDLDNAAALIYGVGEYVQSTTDSVSISVDDYFVLTSTTRVELQYLQNSTGSGAFGTNTWGPNATPRTQISFKITQLQ